MNSGMRIPKRAIVEESESDEEEKQQQQLKKRRNNENRPTQNITAPTPSPSIGSSGSGNKMNGVNESGNKNMDYVNGSIVRIKLNNFVTYSDVEFRPGPRLNVIIGPNGSGKSSIVCAIALGLGGAPTLLGRQKQLGDFIKHRCNSGYIEIELFNENGENYVVKRELRKEGSGASDFKLNGRNISKIDLLATIKKLNVQVDNLCQFLPQDKVVSFASMSPTELLVETEKAININNMFENHQELIKLHAHKEKDSTNYEEIKKNLDELTKKNQALEKDVDKFLERQRLLDTIQLYKQKKAWAIFEQSRRHTLEAKKEKEAKEQEIKVAEQSLKPLKLSIEEQTKSIGKSRKDITDRTAALQRIDSEVIRQTTLDQKLGFTVEQLVKEADGLIKRDQERKVQMAKLNRDIQEETTKLQRLPSDEETKQRVEQVNRELKDWNSQVGELQLEIGSSQQNHQRIGQELHNLTKELSQLDNVQAQKLELLRRDQPQVYQAHEWLKNNQQLFEKKVYGPICLEINVQNPTHAAFLEMTVSFAVWMTFVFQTKKDKDTFHNLVIDGGKRLKLNTLLITRDINIDRVNRIDDFRHDGATHYLDQTFDADPIVKTAIMDSVPIFKSIVFDKRVLGKEDTITKHINSFFTPNGSYYTTYSRYGDRKATTRVTNFKPSKWLSGINVAKKEELQETYRETKERLEQVKHIVDELRGKESQIIQTIRQLKEQRMQSDQTINERRKMYSRIQFLAKKLEDFDQEENIEAEDKRIKQNIKDTYSKRAGLLSKVTELLKEYFLVLGNRDHTLITVSRVEAKLRTEEESYARESDKLNGLRDRVAELTRNVENLIKETKKNKAEAERIAPYSDEMMEDFKKLKGNTFEEIEEHIQAAETKAKFIISTNPRVLEEYEERKREIEKITEKLENRGKELAQNNNRMKKLKEDWLRPVHEFIGQVNSSFSAYFKAIKCEGEVHLGFDEKDPDDFAKYYVDIRVKFRSEDSLKTLNAQLQSGGERSVSTMLYLISLQNLTTCPFRVVDEINQGMDAINERMIFEQIVKSVSSEGSPQYFLITPKLLHNLSYSPETTVLCVYTGPWFYTQGEWDNYLYSLIQKRKNGGNKNNNNNKIKEVGEEDGEEEVDEDSDE